jgi:hypothetical protein
LAKARDKEPLFGTGEGNIEQPLLFFRNVKADVVPDHQGIANKGEKCLSSSFFVHLEFNRCIQHRAQDRMLEVKPVALQQIPLATGTHINHF